MVTASFPHHLIYAKKVAIIPTNSGIDATISFAAKKGFTRARFAVDKFDYTRWFAPEKIKAIKSQQQEYFRWLGKVGYH